ncbi:hypothetical protein JXA32_17155 [Candidatus Sumerlaeota bacterium]|nr:hypothetical protein [Candidatus Sumerlaeota bacterium]
MIRNAPEWLEFSGLPQKLNEKLGLGAWPLFERLVRLDCERNAMPGMVELPLSQLAMRVGQSAEDVVKSLEGFRKLKVGQCFIPEHPDEELLFKVAVPLKTPLKRPAIKQRMREAGLAGPWEFRYLEAEDSAAAEEQLQRVVDLYFDNIQLKVNTFILDELRLLSTRFAVGEIERVFELARRTELRSLKWVAKELYRREKKRQSEQAQTKDIE